MNHHKKTKSFFCCNDLTDIKRHIRKFQTRWGFEYRADRVLLFEDDHPFISGDLHIRVCVRGKANISCSPERMLVPCSGTSLSLPRSLSLFDVRVRAVRAPCVRQVLLSGPVWTLRGGGHASLYPIGGSHIWSTSAARVAGVTAWLGWLSGH